MVPSDTQDTKSAEEWVDPLNVLLAAVPTALGSTTVTEEEDHLIGIGDVTTTQIAVRPPQENPETFLTIVKQNKLTSADVGDNMEDI